MDFDAEIMSLKQRVAALEAAVSDLAGSPYELAGSFDWIAFSDFARFTSEAIGKLTATVSLLLDHIDKPATSASNVSEQSAGDPPASSSAATVTNIPAAPGAAREVSEAPKA